jgi:hypothetical protein
MNSGSYFTNLMSTDFSYAGDYAAGQSDNMEMPPFFGFGQHDDTPASIEIPTQDDPHGARKEKRRTTNFNIDEDKLLVSAWLNVSLDPIQGTDQSKSTYWSRIHQYFHANKMFDSDHS